MAKSTSSRRWLQEHFDDQFVKRAHQCKWRSRASYKLLEIQEKYKIFTPDTKVVDLGAAPGGWSQVASNFINEKGKIIASDILAMEPIPNVKFIHGDFTDDKVFEKILEAVENDQVDLVISDMAPNMSGMKDIDQLKSIALAELALDFVTAALKKQGDFLVKVFHGSGFNEFMLELRKHFSKVISIKPEASRSRSSEVYLLAKGYQK